MDIRKALHLLPKTDLHCHLDGSMRPETILEIASAEKIDIGTKSIRELRNRLVCGEKVTSLVKFLKAFDITCAVMQSKSAIERIAFELAEDAAAENVRYLEVRFAPNLMTKGGLSMEEVLLCARDGLARAERLYPIRTGLIVCALRALPPRLSLELAQLALKMKGHGIVGFDLAHAERGNPAKDHQWAFHQAHFGGLHTTVHAGEDFGPESIRHAIDYCFAERIGHGLTLYQDPGLQTQIAKRKIPLECCPSSNVQIDLVSELRKHPLKNYIRSGVCVTLNTDNRLLTGIKVTDEYLRSWQELGLNWKELKTVALNGFQSAFLPETEKNAMIRSARTEIQEIEKETGII